MRRPSFLTTALGISLLVLSPAFGAMMDGPRMGTFEGIGSHHASGKATITEGQGGKATLTMTNLNVDRVPDGRVYLAKNGDYINGVELGTLKKFSGTITFQIPTTLNVKQYDSVVIWCKRFDVGIGQAFLANGMMEKDGSMRERP